MERPTKMRKTLLLVVLFLVMLALPTALRYVSYYGGAIGQRDVARPDLESLEVPTPPASHYGDETIRPGDGVVVVDMAHSNRLEMPELNVLAGRLAARGHRLTAWSDGSLDDALLEASAFLVAVPQEVFEEEEVAAVEAFVESGGRLLLVGDPTRFSYLTDEYDWVVGIDSDASYLNELGASFGITFVDDYLYNVSDNEGSFRNIKLSDWSDSELTTGLKSVVFFASHSLAVADEAAIIRADDDTWSSATDRAGNLVVAAQAAGGRVLALGDLTFMTEPYHTVRNNSQLIAHVADFLAGAERSYTLVDFPHFLADRVVLVFTNDPELGPGQLQLVDQLQERLDESDRTLVLADTADPGSDTIFAGLYSQADPITDTLAGFGVTLVYTPALEMEEAEDEEAPADPEATGEGEETAEEGPETPEGLVAVDGLGSYDMSGTALIAHRSAGKRQLLAVLAASQEGLASALGRLSEGDLDDCVLADMVTLCPTWIPSEELQASWEPAEAEEPEEEEEEGETGELPEGVQGELADGDTVIGDLGENEEHLWMFFAEAGDVVTVWAEMDSPDADLVLELEDPEGELLALADEGVSGEAEEISDLELTATGDYIIRVSEYAGLGGSYTLSFELAAGQAGGETAGDTIELGEAVEGTLGPDEQAEWAFSAAADQAVVIILEPDENGDVALELQDADGRTLEVSDSGYSGEEERIEGRLPAAGSYRILISEYFGEEVSYSLTLEEGEGGPILGGQGVLVVSADTGTASQDGRTSADVYMEVLSPNYDVTLWSVADDGEIEFEEMQGYQLVIWTSGDFQEGENLPLWAYLLGGGRLLLSGAYPAISEGEETAALRDLEVSGSTSVLTDGFAAGEIIELSGEIDAVVIGYEEDEETVAVFLRGPASDEAGDVIAAGVDAGDSTGIKYLLVGLPLYMLPEANQAQIIENAMEWFQVVPSS